MKFDSEDRFFVLPVPDCGPLYITVEDLNSAISTTENSPTAHTKGLGLV